jgi:hypothetical protein
MFFETFNAPAMFTSIQVSSKRVSISLDLLGKKLLGFGRAFVGLLALEGLEPGSIHTKR